MTAEKRGFVPARFGRELLPEEKAHMEGAREKSGKTEEERQQLYLEMVEARDRTLAEAGDLPQDIREKAVKKFIELARDVKISRKAFRKAKEGEEKEKWARIFASQKKALDKYLDDPKQNLQFEKAFREWVAGRAQHAKFLRIESQLAQVESGLAAPAFSGEPKGFSQNEIARLERVSQRGDQLADSETAEAIAELQYLYTEGELTGEEGRKQYDALVETFLREPEEVKKSGKRKKTKADLQREKEKLEKQLDRMWEEESGVTHNEAVRQLDQLLKDLNEGEDVLELPSVIRSLNQLSEWERLHSRTTVGGVLVGEPGTGKTTLVHHYLESRGRNYVYLDFSEEVTRYMLFGSKQMELKSSTEYFSELAKQIAGMSNAEFESFIREHAKTVAETYHLAGDESEAAFFKMLDEEMQKAETSGTKIPKINEAKAKMEGTVGQLYRKELAGKFKHLVQKNGWRDGVLISALRRGDSVICDEFVKMKDPTLIYGLLTSKPGESWYFADNDQTIDIPPHWRMYFTANIGRKHGGYRVAEALASRAQGKVMEVVYPPAYEELTVGLAGICDSEGYFLSGKEDITGTLILIKDVFPKIRSLIKGKEPTIPISWRTIRDIGEKLISEKEVGGKKIRQRTKKSFDEALYEVLAESYRVYEDKTVPREVVNICTSLGLMLDDKVKDRITKRDEYLSEEEFAKRRTAKDEHKKDWDDIVKEIQEGRAMERAFMGVGRPERKTV